MAIMVETDDGTETVENANRIQSLAAVVAARAENASELFAAKIIECLFERFEQDEVRAIVDCAAERLKGAEKLKRIPVRQNDEFVFVPVDEIVSIVAHGEFLHLTTTKGECFIIDFRLKGLESKLDNSKFVRLSRGSLVNLDFVASFKPMPAGTYLATLTNRQQLTVSRSRGRILREILLKL